MPTTLPPTTHRQTPVLKFFAIIKLNLYQIKRQWQLLHWALPQNSRFVLKPLLLTHITDKQLCSSYILNHTCREAAHHRDVGSPQLGSQVLGSPRRDGASHHCLQYIDIDISHYHNQHHRLLYDHYSGDAASQTGQCNITS